MKQQPDGWSLDQMRDWVSRSGPNGRLGRRFYALMDFLNELASLRLCAEQLQVAQTSWEWGMPLYQVLHRRLADLARLQGLTESARRATMRGRRRLMTLEQLRACIKIGVDGGAPGPVFWEELLNVLDEYDRELMGRAVRDQAVQISAKVYQRLMQGGTE